MKRILFICASLFPFSSLLPAQPVFTPSSPVLTPSPAFVSGSPVLSGLSGPPVNTNLPSTTGGSFGMTNVTVALTNLQAAVEIALPAVQAFNDAVDASRSPASNLNVAGGTGSTLVSTFLGTPALAAVASTNLVARDTVRAMVVLQSDLERALGLLNVLNGGGTNGLTSAATTVGLLNNLQPGSITNVIGP